MAPSVTLFVGNLPEKVKKPELRSSLYALFTPYGKVADVVATRGKGMRGQAHVVFRDLTASTAALRGLDGESFFGKQLKIQYANGTSHATILHTSGPEALYALKTGASTSKTSRVTVSNAQMKRKRGDGDGAEEEEEEEEEEEDEDEEKGAKRRKAEEETKEDEEMEQSDDDEDGPQPA